MPLTPGTRFGPYEIVGPIGAGGMGEVYRARDTKLDRDVALKVLPEAFAADADRVARFEREAKLLASMNHPNIASIYGFESGALVLELVEGPTLADRIRQGPVPLDEAIPLFVQIAKGLAAAHEKGIIHRDLKPANIKIGADGTPKILDFGLAKAFVGDDDTASDSSQSPTLTKGTALGAILGTASYMSPEQARGKPVDETTDVWAFGCCLYEALTGTPAFRGETVSDILAAVLKTEPSWDALPPLPVQADIVLRQCLRKDRSKRLQHVIDGAITLEDAAAEEIRPTSSPSPSVAGKVALVAGLLIAAVAVWSLLANDREEPSEAHPVRRLAISIDGASFSDLSGLSASALAFSPDGDALVYAASVDGVQQLFLRPLDSDIATPLEGTEGGAQPFFSPDGEWIGYVAGRGVISKVPVGGGPPVAVAEMQGSGTGIIVGATWGPRGEIFFSEMEKGVVRVSENGGSPEIVLAPNERENEVHIYWPRLLPDGDTMLITVGRSEVRPTSIEAFSLRDGSRHELVDDGRQATFASSGHLLFHRGDRLMATMFDLRSLEVTGRPFVAIEKVHRGKDFAVSGDGTLAYVSGDWETSRTVRLLWVDRAGTTTAIGEPARYGRTSAPRLSPDATRLAVANMLVNTDGPDVWALDLDKETFQRITVTPGLSGAVSPIWSRDGETLFVRSDREGGVWKTFEVPADGAGLGRKVTNAGDTRISSISSDATKLVITEYDTESGSNIATLSLDGDAPPKTILGGDFDEHSGMLSPNDRWLAYVSNESGQDEVYVVSFPDAQTKELISVNGGSEPMWSRDGKELFYRNDDKMMAVATSTTDGFRADAPRELFEGRFRRDLYGRGAHYDVHPDGQRFVMVEEPDAAVFAREIRIVLNWFDELKRVAPPND